MVVVVMGNDLAPVFEAARAILNDVVVSDIPLLTFGFRLKLLDVIASDRCSCRSAQSRQRSVGGSSLNSSLVAVI